MSSSCLSPALSEACCGVGTSEPQLLQPFFGQLRMDKFSCVSDPSLTVQWLQLHALGVRLLKPTAQSSHLSTNNCLLTPCGVICMSFRQTSLTSTHPIGVATDGDFRRFSGG